MTICIVIAGWRLGLNKQRRPFTRRVIKHGHLRIRQIFDAASLEEFCAGCRLRSEMILRVDVIN